MCFPFFAVELQQTVLESTRVSNRPAGHELRPETSLLWLEGEDTPTLFYLIAASPSQPPTKATFNDAS